MLRSPGWDFTCRISRDDDSEANRLRFKVGDSVLILTRYAHLYPSDSGVIVEVGSPDPFRSEFNEYTVKFPDGSTGNLFEFQLMKRE